MNDNMFPVEVVPYGDKEYRLLHGHCSSYPDGKTRCTNWATRRLRDDSGATVPGGAICQDCARETIVEYRKVGMYWSAAPVVLYRVNGRVFRNRDHAQEYADELNEETA